MPMWGPSVSATLTSVTAATTSTPVLPDDQGERRGVLIYNDSTATMYLAYDSTASTTHYTLQIAAGGYWEMPGALVYGGPLSAVWSAANGAARVTALTE